MILLCKPRGRGNWHTTTFAIQGGHWPPPPILANWSLRVGLCFTLGEITWRICKIIA